MNALFVAWRSGEPRDAVWGPVGRLEHDGQIYRFQYTLGARTLPGFTPFPGMDDLEEAYESVELLPLFANRLLSPSRPEYEAFLRWGGFDVSVPPSPLAILGVTEGLRKTDYIETFPCPVPDSRGCYVNTFFLHGIRWMPPHSVERLADLRPNERLFLMPDPCNPADPNAVAVRTESQRTLIGYVPRYLARDVRFLLSECDHNSVELCVERVNREAPLQQRLLCRLRTCWPDGFRPCADESFQPICSPARGREPSSVYD